jgi:hypothetical protein
MDPAHKDFCDQSGHSNSSSTSTPIPVSLWESQGHAYPTVNGWYNRLRPENQRDELVEAGVASFVNGRWLIFPDAWQEYCRKNHRPRGR